MSEDLVPVSVERSDGRILTGGSSVADLQETMERHAPPDDSPVVAAGEPVSSPAPVDAAAGDPPPVKKTRGQARFDQLTGEREAAKREAEAAKQETAALKAQLAALEAGRGAAPVATPATPSAAPSTPAPQKFTFPAYDVYVASNPNATWDDWQDAKMDAHSDWKIAKAQTDLDARVRSSIEADRASRTHADTVEAILTRGRGAYADFDAVRESVADVGFAPSKIQYLLKQPTAEHLIYQIAKDRALASRLSSMDDVEFGATVRGLVPSAGAAPLASTPAAGSVIAPPPYQPVGSGSKTTVTPSADLARKGFDFDASGYRERRAAERGMRR